MIDFGETFSSDNFEVRDTAGALANAGTVTATITLPDATTTSPTVANPSTGVYNFDYLTTQAGRHTFVVTATGGILGSLVRKWSDTFEVAAADPGFIISLTDAVDYLGEQDTRTHEKIRRLLASTTKQIENRIGPVVVRSFTDRIRAGTHKLFLPNVPVISVTSITSIKYPTTTYATAELDVDAPVGAVCLLSSGPFVNGPWNAVYKAGRADVPDDIIEAAQRLLWHAWTTQRGLTADSVTPDIDDVGVYERFTPGAAHALPWYVDELLAPYKPVLIL